MVVLIKSPFMMKSIRVFIFCFSLMALPTKAQTFDVSPDFSIRNNVENYGLVGKFGERTLFFYQEGSEMVFKTYDDKMHFLNEKRWEGERKNGLTVLDVYNGRNDFTVIYQIKRKGHGLLKMLRFDPQVRLLDSITLKDYGKDFFDSPKLKLIRSEDRKTGLVYRLYETDKVQAIAFGLDSLYKLWDTSFKVDRDVVRDIYENLTDVLVSNNAEMSMVWDVFNQKNKIKKHALYVAEFSTADSLHQYQYPLPDFITESIKVGYDNFNKHKVAAGFYSPKGTGNALGWFWISDIRFNGQSVPSKIKLHPFDDAYISSLLGKKVVNNKGLENLKMQEIVMRRDGGCVLIAEEVEIRIRATNRIVPYNTNYPTTNNTTATTKDYYFENMLVCSLHPNGEMHWQHILHKKQSSQNDGGITGSYFLMKTQQALRLLYNDDTDRDPLASEFVIKPNGDFDRHILLNTNGQNLALRFKDAMHVSANEVIVVSEQNSGKLKVVKIRY
jgi:hypothetical protein